MWHVLVWPPGATSLASASFRPRALLLSEACAILLAAGAVKDTLAVSQIAES